MINADDMQSWAYLLAPTFQFVNTAGKPLTEGWIEVYIAGTRNKYYCASDFNGTLHPFQIPLDSLGANIVLANPDQAYDVYVYNKYGSLIMSRYHVSPGMAGGSGVLNITIGSEDGTVSVNNDGNGNFDLSIKDTVDRIEVLEQTVSDLSSNSSVGYAIAHAYTVELDGSFDLISDAVTGIGYTPNMDGFRLKSGHVYQFNFNALFENGEFDRNCSGKLYLEGPNTIAQEWKFDLDDSYYHSQSINGSTVLVTPNDLNYYDVKLKLAWDVDYPNKPNVDLNKISIVDITTILSTTVSGVGGNYTGGDGIFVNDETYVISVDMDYINSHLNIDATEIIASAVNIATAYTDARVTSVSGDLVNLIAEVSASIPTGSVTQVQSDWNEQDSSSPAYIQHKPDLTVYATHDEVSGVSAVLNERINYVSGSIPELPGEEEVEFEEVDLSDYALVSSIPDISNLVTHDEFVSAVTAVSSMIPDDYVTHNEVSAVSANIVNYVNSVSGDITNYVDESIVSAINVATGYFEPVQSDWTEDNTTDPAYIKNKPNEIEIVAGQNIGIFYDATTITIAASAVTGTGTNYQAGYGIDITGNTISVDASIIPSTSDYATKQELATVSGMIPDVSSYATHTEVNNVSGTLNTKIDNVSASIPTLPSEEEVEFEEIDLNEYALVSEIPDVSNLATKSELQTVSASIPDVSNFVTSPTVSAIVDEALIEIDIPTGVSGVVAGDGISITASGSDYVISCTVTGGGSGTTYTAGDYIGIVDDTISVTGITDVVAGNCVSITSSGNSAVIDWNTTGGITDIQIVNSLPASPVSTVLYLIPET